MNDPFASLGLAVHRLRYAIVPFWVVVAVTMGGLFAVKATDVLKGGGFYTPDSHSQKADDALARYFHAGSSTTALIAFQSRSATVDDAGYRDEVTATEDRLKTVRNVHSVTSYYDTQRVFLAEPGDHDQRIAPNGCA